MITAEFFDLVLPDTGLRCIAVPAPGVGFRHSFKDTNSAAAAFAQDADQRGASVYFACSSFLTKDSRLGSNVASVRSFWLDLDCGAGKPYPDQRAALVALVAFIRAVGLPAPVLVSSGVGVHVYWPMDADMTPDTWRATAALLKAACKQFNLHADPSRTSDIASVLRPVGTTHRKAGAKPVTLLKIGQQTGHAAFEAALTAYLGVEAAPLGPMPAGLAATFAGNDDLKGGIEYPPAYADRIADQCGVVGLVRETKGCVDQPTWFHVLQVLAFCEDGETAAHDWSSGHKTYSKAETDGVLARVKAFKPTSCAKLEDYQPSICKACPKFGKIHSPMALGFEPAAIPITPAPTPTPNIGNAFGITIEPEDKRHGGDMPFGYAWTHTGHHHQLCRRVKVGEDFEWAPFSDTLLYPIGRLGDDLDGFSNEYEMVVKDGENRRFLIPTSTINEGGKSLASILGRYEVAALPRMSEVLSDYLRAWMTRTRLDRDATLARQHFGWHGRSFLVGNTLLSPGGAKVAVLKGQALLKAAALTPAGSLDVWKEVIDTAYNYPGQEALQFCVMMSFAAPVFAMQKQLQGVTAYAHSSGTGAGKTTAQNAGLSAWGNHAELQLADKSATEGGLRTLLGTYHNLPVVFDELTNMSNAAASQLVFDVSNGKMKQRLTSSGDMKTNNDNWQTILLTSGNNMLTEKLSMHRANAEAEMARVFEFRVSSRSRLTTSEANDLFPKLLENYGQAGLSFANYLVAHYDAVAAVQAQVRTAFDAEAGILQGERYWSALASSVLTALMVCRKLDIVMFDVTSLKAWIIQQIEQNRAGRDDMVSLPTEQFGSMLADLWPGILVTWGEGDLRKGLVAEVVDKRYPHGSLTGRAIIGMVPNEKTILLLNTTSVREWCNKRGVSAKEIFDAGVGAGIISPQVTRYSLGKGTNLLGNSSSLVKCWLVDPEKMGVDVMSPSIAQKFKVYDTPNISGVVSGISGAGSD